MSQVDSDTDVSIETSGITEGKEYTVAPEDLKPHPRNDEVYVDTDVSDIVDSLEEHGFVQYERIVIKSDKTILSGHRRWEAAKQVGLDEVPVVEVKPESEVEELRLVLLENRYRDKTPGEKINEGELWEEIERLEAKRRMSQGGKGGMRSDDQERGGKISTPSKSRDKVGEKIGVSGRTYEKGKKVKDIAVGKEEAPEQVQEVAKEQWDALQEGEQSFHGAQVEVEQAEREVEEEKEQQRLEVTRKTSYESADETLELHEGNFDEVLDDFEDESFDHIVTDPPYDEDAMEAWRALAENAVRVLKPGGFLIAYSGKYHLPEVFRALDAHLEYYWQVILVHDSPGAKFFARKMRTNYKPILIFAKPPVEPQEDFVVDVIHGSGREKDDHEWQQAEAESAELLERFTNTNDRILDPMCGSGTVGVACQRLDRRCVLIDQDSEAVDVAHRRCFDDS